MVLIPGHEATWVARARARERTALIWSPLFSAMRVPVHLCLAQQALRVRYQIPGYALEVEVEMEMEVEVEGVLGSRTVTTCGISGRGRRMRGK